MRACSITLKLFLLILFAYFSWNKQVSDSTIASYFVLTLIPISGKYNGNLGKLGLSSHVLVNPRFCQLVMLCGEVCFKLIAIGCLLCL